MQAGPPPLGPRQISEGVPVATTKAVLPATFEQFREEFIAAWDTGDDEAKRIANNKLRLAVDTVRFRAEMQMYYSCYLYHAKRGQLINAMVDDKKEGLHVVSAPNKNMVDVSLLPFLCYVKLLATKDQFYFRSTTSRSAPKCGHTNPDVADFRLFFKPGKGYNTEPDQMSENINTDNTGSGG